MSLNETRLDAARRLKVIIDTELSKPFPRIPEVKKALADLSVLLVSLALAADAIERGFAGVRNIVLGLEIDVRNMELREKSRHPDA
jgi:hypothetical protein